VKIDVDTGAVTYVGAGLELEGDLPPLGLGYDSNADAFFLSDAEGGLHRVDKATGAVIRR
jgi:hypothetical protein